MQSKEESSMADPATGKARPNRMSRQRQKTHDRLVKAALSVMADKGADAATINDITEAADVGFGSFYNHFSSKEEILAVAIEELYVQIGNLIDAAVKDISDPLELLATALRLFVGIIIPKPDWARFIVRVSLVPDYKKAGLFPRLFRDIQAVEDAGRLHMVDSETATYAVAGAMLFMVIALLQGDLPAEGADKRICSMALRILGVDEDEINQMMNRPLPALAEEPAA